MTAPDDDRPCSCEESERLKARITELEAGNALLLERVTQANDRVRELEAELSGAQKAHEEQMAQLRKQDANNCGAMMASESALRALRERAEKALRILGPESGTFVNAGRCVTAAMAALRG